MSSLILAALHDEIRDFKAKMALDCTAHFQPSTLYRGKAFHREASLLVTGIGAQRVRRALEKTCEIIKPGEILLVGYCGGASPVAGQGNLVLADKVVEAATEESFGTDSPLLTRAKAVAEAQKISWQSGAIAAVDRVLVFPHEKADLGATHSVIALDMESAAVGRFAKEHRIPFLAAKAVLDPVEESLPPLEKGYEEAEESQWKQFAQYFLKNPKAMMKLPKLIHWAAQARRAIAEFLEGWCLVP